MKLKAKLARLERELAERPPCRACREWVAIVEDEKEITEDFMRCPVCGRRREGPVLIVDDLLDDGHFDFALSVPAKSSGFQPSIQRSESWADLTN